jgi:hypothetical protein
MKLSFNTNKLTLEEVLFLESLIANKKRLLMGESIELIPTTKEVNTPTVEEVNTPTVEEPTEVEEVNTPTVEEVNTPTVEEVNTPTVEEPTEVEEVNTPTVEEPTEVEEVMENTSLIDELYPKVNRDIVDDPIFELDELYPKKIFGELNYKLDSKDLMENERFNYMKLDNNITLYHVKIDNIISDYGRYILDGVDLLEYYEDRIHDFKAYDSSIEYDKLKCRPSPIQLHIFESIMQGRIIEPNELETHPKGDETPSIVDVEGSGLYPLTDGLGYVSKHGIYYLGIHSKKVEMFYNNMVAERKSDPKKMLGRLNRRIRLEHFDHHELFDGYKLDNGEVLEYKNFSEIVLESHRYYIDNIDLYQYYTDRVDNVPLYIFESIMQGKIVLPDTLTKSDTVISKDGFEIYKLNNGLGYMAETKEGYHEGIDIYFYPTN